MKAMYLGIVDGGSAKSVSFEIPEGDAGTEATLEWIRKLIYQGVRDPQVNRLAVGILQGVPAHDQTAEAKAIYQWVRANIRFTGDIYSAETLRQAAEILSVRAGDCDDINGVLLPTLLESVGIESRLVTVAADDSRPDTFSHIYPEANLDGRWVPMDAAAKHASFRKEPSTVYRKRVWDLHSSAYQDVGPASMLAPQDAAARMAALHGLGQDDGDGFDWSALTQELPQIISTSTAGAASILKAVNTPSYPTYGTATVINPATGLPVTAPTVTATASVSSSPMGVVVVGLALLLVSVFALAK